MGEGLLCIHTLPSSFTCTIHNQQKDPILPLNNETARSDCLIYTPARKARSRISFLLYHDLTTLLDVNTLGRTLYATTAQIIIDRRGRRTDRNAIQSHKSTERKTLRSRNTSTIEPGHIAGQVIRGDRQISSSSLTHGQEKVRQALGSLIAQRAAQSIVRHGFT